MWKKIVISAAAGGALLIAGTAALADTTSPSAPASSSATASVGASSSAAPSGTARANRRAKIRRQFLRGVQHAQWVTGRQGGTFVTHDAIRGKVTAVSATSLTVLALDNTSETYSVTSTTKVHIRSASARATLGSISQVKVGEQVGVLGTGAGSGPYTATQVLAAS
jgi:hypothetical protein